MSAQFTDSPCTLAGFRFSVAAAEYFDGQYVYTVPAASVDLVRKNWAPPDLTTATWGSEFFGIGQTTGHEDSTYQFSHPMDPRFFQWRGGAVVITSLSDALFAPPGIWESLAYDTDPARLLVGEIVTLGHTFASAFPFHVRNTEPPFDEADSVWSLGVLGRWVDRNTWRWRLTTDLASGDSWPAEIDLPIDRAAMSGFGTALGAITIAQL